MFSKEELQWIQIVLNQINFKTGQKDQYLMNEQILGKINNELNKHIDKK